MLDREYFLELGGFDCSFEYPNFNIHDLIFRLQYDGGVIENSPVAVAHIDCYAATSIDHAPIHTTFYEDEQKFIRKYNDPNALNQSTAKIDIDNWKNYSSVWHRRFGKKLYTSYREMLIDTHDPSEIQAVFNRIGIS